MLGNAGHARSSREGNARLSRSLTPHGLSPRAGSSRLSHSRRLLRRLNMALLIALLYTFIIQNGCFSTVNLIQKTNFGSGKIGRVYLAFRIQNDLNVPVALCNGRRRTIAEN